MISVEEALAKVLEHAHPSTSTHVKFTDALGLVLAEDVRSDIDSPPHDKSLVDGYAVIASDVSRGVELRILEEVTAGQTPTTQVVSSSATRIMTGAPIPSGADAVVMVEQTKVVGDRVRLDVDAAKPEQNIMRQATSMQEGAVVVRAGQEIRPIEIGVLAEVGATEVSVHARPSVAVLSTGNELVPADQFPGVGEIRNSNGPMLEALARRAGATPVNLGIGRDTRDDLSRRVELGLAEDVLVLSGGVSAGVLDLVPAVLAANGVAQVFHKVHLKPGKPLWFGIKQEGIGINQDGARPKLVFGLPGNPVSSLVCFELFVRPALRAIARHQKTSLEKRTALIAREHQQRGDRPTYFPARLFESDGQLHVEPLAWKGSADLSTLAQADCLAYFPPGDRVYVAGDRVEVFVLM